MQSLDRSRLRIATIVLGITACGDDGAVTEGSADGSTTGTDGESTGPTSATQGESSDSVDPDTSSSGVVDESSTTVVDESSTTGEPNTPPDAIDDDYFVTMDATPLVVDAAMGVLANDIDADGDALSVAASDALSARGGAVTIAVDGAIDYGPLAGMWGMDEFGYTASDGQGGADDAVVRVMVAPTTVSLGDLDGDPVGFSILGVADLDDTGWQVAGGSDVNGDGFADVVVGAPLADAAGSGEGRAWVVFGKADGAAVDLADLAAPGFAIDGIATGDDTGFAVAMAGDVNGDGLADVVVGAPGADPLGNDEGMAWIVFGKSDMDPVVLATLVADGAGIAIAGLAADDELGSAVAGGGDIDGDGLDDVLVAAPLAEVGINANAGRVWVVRGRTDAATVDLAEVATGTGGFVISGAGSEHHAGDAIDIVGDVNGDGLDDVIVGAPLADPNGGNSGEAYVVLGKADGAAVALASVVSGIGGFRISGEAGLDQSGDSVARAGDVDGDGLADVIVGAPGAEDDINLQGRSYVVLGKTDTDAVDLIDVAAGVGGFAIDGELESDLSGWSVGGGGDVDGDGLSDVIVGAQGVDAAGFGSGRTYVVYGRTETTQVSLVDVAGGLGGFAIDGEAAGDVSGWAVAGAADASGDGLADVLIGAIQAPDGTGSGRAYVVFGGDFRDQVTAAGTAGVDRIEGTADDDTLLGGLGADLVRTNGGYDVVYTGPGDDTIALTTTELFRIDGGTGMDTLALDGAGLQLELGSFFDAAIVGIETVDLTGAGDNALFLSARDLRALSDTSNTLFVLGDAGDQVVADFTGAGFVDQGLVNGFRVWSTGVLALFVQEQIEAFVQT